MRDIDNIAKDLVPDYAYESSFCLVRNAVAETMRQTMVEVLNVVRAEARDCGCSARIEKTLAWTAAKCGAQPLKYGRHYVEIIEPAGKIDGHKENLTTAVGLLVDENARLRGRVAILEEMEREAFGVSDITVEVSEPGVYVISNVSNRIVNRLRAAAEHGVVKLTKPKGQIGQ